MRYFVTLLGGQTYLRTTKRTVDVVGANGDPLVAPVETEYEGYACDYSVESDVLAIAYPAQELVEIRDLGSGNRRRWEIPSGSQIALDRGARKLLMVVGGRIHQLDCLSGTVDVVPDAKLNPLCPIVRIVGTNRVLLASPLKETLFELDLYSARVKKVDIEIGAALYSPILDLSSEVYALVSRRQSPRTIALVSAQSHEPIWVSALPAEGHVSTGCFSGDSSLLGLCLVGPAPHYKDEVLVVDCKSGEMCNRLEAAVDHPQPWNGTSILERMVVGARGETRSLDLRTGELAQARFW